MVRTTLHRHAPPESERAGRLGSSRGVKTWKRALHAQGLASARSPRRPHSDSRRRSWISNKLQKPSRSSKLFRDDELTYFVGEDDIMHQTESEQESEQEVFYWDEEQTLFSDLVMEGADPKEYQSDGWTDLLESLEEAFGKNSIAFKKETAHAFVPTVNRMKECFHLCEEQNKSYGEGILMLNSALKKYEMMVVKTEDDMKGAYSSAQNRVDMILKQLREAYSQRDKLWARLYERIAQIAEPVVQELKTVPANIERIIAAQEKKGRAQEKEEGNSTLLTEEMLKELLKKL